MNRLDQWRTEEMKGLSTEEVLCSRQRYGRNEVAAIKRTFWKQLLGFFKEPMVVLLLVGGILYFMTGAIQDGVFLMVAVVLISGISFYQESRSRKAMEALRELTQPTNKLIRNGSVISVNREEIVVGDCLLVEEGSIIPADGIILHCNDFSVNESILTGEALTVNKSERNEQVYQGTSVVTGLAICKVTAIASNTRLGRIGKIIEELHQEKSPLQKQIQDFVKKMALIGMIVFLLVWCVNFLHTQNIVTSLLQALTLAMSILPEEIPVAFSTFMALGAWHLMHRSVIIKNTSTVETLGSASVICVDKTGTLTENQMSLTKIFVHNTSTIAEPNDVHQAVKEVIYYAMWASEPIPFQFRQCQ